jgi:hypothetical protein
MTDTTDFAVGDLVEIDSDREQTFPRIGNAYGNLGVRPGVELTVTRVFSEQIIVRGPILRTGGGLMADASVQVDKSRFRLVDPNRPLPRKLGTKPEGEEFIGIDHPGLQWLFNDMGAYAEREGYCGQYYALCIKLGIPGRPRDFTVRTTVKGIHLSTTVKARSQREANQIVKDALADPESITIDPDFAPAA